MHIHHHYSGWLPLLLSMTITACAPGGNREAMDNPWNQPQDRATQANLRTQTDSSRRQQENLKNSKAVEAANAAPEPLAGNELYRGSGNFVNLKMAEAPPDPVSDEGNVTLNFQGSDIADVVKTILGDILQVNYSLDDRVSGPVYLQTSQPIAQEDLLPTLESLLRFHGAALVRNDNFYDIVPTDALPPEGLSPRLKVAEQRGYQMLIVPLRYIAAKEMAKILEPLVGQQTMQVDERRNQLTLAGPRNELLNLQETIGIFDVDQLRGMSVGLFRLRASDPQIIAQELQTIFGDQAEGPLAGMVQYLPIERLNALLVMTPQAKYLQDARLWIERLDRAENPRGMNMYVYYVQNGKAESMAELLNQLFEGQRRNASNNERENGASTPADNETPATDSPNVRINAGSAGFNASSLDVGDVNIIADTDLNALLIMSSANDYQKVYQAVRKLDVQPLQVLVEATIVEVTLEDELRYGLQWFFKHNFDGYSGAGAVGQLPIPSPFDGNVLASATYEVFNATGTRALLTALAQDSKVNVVSSPSLMVLDNHTATIRVGDQVPVRTSQTTNTSSDLGNITSTIQFKDTGVLLEVTPRVNAGGMVILEIAQEVNDVSATTTSGIDSPTITQRKIDTKVAVQSGQTLVLGGLIKENKDEGSEGVPVLRHVPVLGWIFGSSGKKTARTELVVMITPTAVTDQQDARKVTDEYRQKLQGLTLNSLPPSRL